MLTRTACPYEGRVRAGARGIELAILASNQENSCTRSRRVCQIPPMAIEYGRRDSDPHEPPGPAAFEAAVYTFHHARVRRQSLELRIARLRVGCFTGIARGAYAIESALRHPKVLAVLRRWSLAQTTSHLAISTCINDQAAPACTISAISATLSP